MFFPLKYLEASIVQGASITSYIWISYQTTWKKETLFSKAISLELYDIQTSLATKGGFEMFKIKIALNQPTTKQQETWI